MTSCTLLMAPLLQNVARRVNTHCSKTLATKRIMRTLGERLRFARRQANFASASAAADALAIPISTYNSHERSGSDGGRDPDVEQVRRYARFFRVSLAWLLTGEGSAEPRNIAKVVGLVGAGAEIQPEIEQIPSDGLGEVEVPIPLPDDAIAFEVSGDSMRPRYDPGDLIISWNVSPDGASAVGLEAIVDTSDGRRFLKRVISGATKGTFDLESHNADPIRGVHIRQVYSVDAIVRNSATSKLRKIRS